MGGMDSIQQTALAERVHAHKLLWQQFVRDMRNGRSIDSRPEYVEALQLLWQFCCDRGIPFTQIAGRDYTYLREWMMSMTTKYRHTNKEKPYTPGQRTQTSRVRANQQLSDVFGGLYEEAADGDDDALIDGVEDDEPLNEEEIFAQDDIVVDPEFDEQPVQSSSRLPPVGPKRDRPYKVYRAAAQAKRTADKRERGDKYISEYEQRRMDLLKQEEHINELRTSNLELDTELKEQQRKINEQDIRIRQMEVHIKQMQLEQLMAAQGGSDAGGAGTKRHAMLDDGGGGTQAKVARGP